MPFTLSTLVPGRADCFPSRSSARSRNQPRPYFPPGGQHDRHSIPPSQLHVSLTDPVLVAAEQKLSTIPDAQGRSKPPNIKDAGARKAAKSGSVVFHPKKAEIPSHRSGDDNVTPPVPEAVDLKVAVLNTPEIDRKTGLEESAAHLPDPCDISEVMTIDGSPGDADSSASEESPSKSDLGPLASELFKQELYIRGYLKRPASRSSNVPRKPRNSLMLMSRKVFPKVLGRHQGRKVAECLRAGKDIAETPDGLETHLVEMQSTSSVESVTLRTPRADGLDSPGMNTSTSATGSFDLHEFSYITAFTTPPSSPSIILDAETLKKGVNAANSKHAA